MRNTLCALGAICLTFILTVDAPAPALAEDAPQTVTDYANAMNAAALRLDTQVSDRQKAGDMATAQRLMLTAAMVRRGAEEFRSAEQASLTNDVSGLPAPVPALVDAALAKAKEAELSAARQPAFVDDAHRTFNALIAGLPLKTPHPVFYGLLSNDLAEPDAPLPTDAVIYGFRLIDPVSKNQPVVLFNNKALPPGSAAITDTRIDVTLPDEVKKAINFTPPPCDPRPSFGLRITETYSQRRGFWPISWYEDIFTNTDLYALPSPRLFSAEIVASAEAAAGEASIVDFSQKSNLALANCGQTKAVDVTIPLPPNAKDVKCEAVWVDTSGTAKLMNTCGVEGQAVRAHGEISGGPQVCSPPPNQLCTCSVLGQGWLEAKGTYRVEEEASKVKTKDAPSVNFASGAVSESRLPVGDGEKLRHVLLKISRRFCPTILDDLDITIGQDTSAVAEGVSSTGAFRATVKDGVLRVGAADAFAEDIGKTP